MQDNTYTQTYLVQSIVKCFVQKKNPDFQSFLQIWRDLNGVRIHSLTSPRNLVFGRCQAAYQTFLGYILYKKNEIEIIAGLYGIYIIYETQNLPIKEGILITSDEYVVISQKIKEIDALHPIYKYLVQSSAFVFSAISYAIPTQFTEYPPQVVSSERPQYTLIMESKKEKYIRKHFINPIKPISTEEDEETYKQLMSDIFEHKTEIDEDVQD